jgi:16S rRNA (guanine(966)-N(2))-methyltransferase RsmD
MRITGGKYTNRRIQCPKGEIRPAMDRMRESLFSILGNLTGTSFLDLFSGSGLVALEAASRGADPVVLVERDYKKGGIIRKNLEIAEEEMKLFLMPAEKYIKTADRRFDTVFLDPPFSYQKKERLLTLVSEKGILEDGGILLLHYPAEDEIPEQTGDLVQYRINTYGRSLVRFYRRNPGLL